MKKKIISISVIILFAFFSISCQLFSKITESITPGSDPEVTDLTNYVIRDDFNNNKNNWVEGENDGEYADAQYDFVDGVYVWTVTSYQLANVVSWPDMETVEDFTANVTAKQTSDNADDCDYGLIYRQPDGNVFLSFTLSNKDFSVYVYNIESSWTELIPWTNSDAIRPGEDNLLTVTRSGDEFTFYANNELLTSVTYSDITEGELGLNVDIFPAGATGIFEFDDFSVSIP